MLSETLNSMHGCVADFNVFLAVAIDVDVYIEPDIVWELIRANREYIDFRVRLWFSCLYGSHDDH